MFIDTGLKIDGTDITNLIAEGGVSWSRNDVDGPNAGRTITGLMVRDRVATKIRLDITCRPLNQTEHSMLMKLLMPDFVTVNYDDPVYGNCSKIMYANNHSSVFLIKHADGSEYWGDVSFPLIER